MDNSRNCFSIFLIWFFCVSSSSAHINLLNPGSGETFAVGDIITISWEEGQTHVPIDFDLQFSSDGGVTWEDIASLNVDQFEYQWMVPDIETDQGKIKVIQDNEGMDYTDISSNFAISTSGLVTAVEDHGDHKPSVNLHNYPNPFLSGTNIEFTLPQLDHVSLEIYNLQGAKMATLKDEVLAAGKYTTPWNAPGSKPGMYLIQVRIGTYSETRKLIKLE